jgi:hypothetical protein
VIVIDENTASGGDSAMFYMSAEISGDREKIAVSLHVRQHDNDKFSVFGDVNEFTLSLTGRKKGAASTMPSRAGPTVRHPCALRRSMSPAPK